MFYGVGDVAERFIVFWGKVWIMVVHFNSGLKKKNKPRFTYCQFVFLESEYGL